MDAQVDLHLCCSHMALTVFLMTWINSGYPSVPTPVKSTAEGPSHIAPTLQPLSMFDFVYSQQLE